MASSSWLSELLRGILFAHFAGKISLALAHSWIFIEDRVLNESERVHSAEQPSWLLAENSLVLARDVRRDVAVALQWPKVACFFMTTTVSIAAMSARDVSAQVHYRIHIVDDAWKAAAAHLPGASVLAGAEASDEVAWK